MSLRACCVAMVIVAMLAGCDGCNGAGITSLSLGDASFDVRDDGGLDGLDDRPRPDGGTTGVAGAAIGTTGGTGATAGFSGGVAGSASGIAGAGAQAGSAGTSGGSGIGGSWAGTGGRTGTGGAAGRAGTGGSGGSDSGVRCDVYSTCWYPDGTICDQNGFCCSVDASGRCCDGESCKPAPTWNAPPVLPTVDEPWLPPLPEEDLGAPGWRESDEVFCTNRPGNTYAHSVWSDSRGVFVAAIGDDNGADTTCPWCIKESLYFNDGTGWTPVPGAASGDPDDVQVSSGQLTLTGFDNGPLVLYGYGAYHPQTGQPCSLAMLDNGERECQPVDGVSDVHVVSSTLAYGALNGSLIRYDGERWGPVPAAAPSQGALYMIWANDAVVMGTGQMPGTIYTLRDGTWSVENTRTLEYFTSIWGFAANDVWAGTQQGGLYHYDGTAWNEIAWPGSSCNYDSQIIGIWGSGGVVYFVTTTAIGRWNGTQAETIAEWACDGSGFNARITSVWGNSPTEVFFSIVDDRRPVNACGSAFVMYYDGDKFHPM